MYKVSMVYYIDEFVLALFVLAVHSGDREDYNMLVAVMHQREFRSIDQPLLETSLKLLCGAVADIDSASHQSLLSAIFGMNMWNYRPSVMEPYVATKKQHVISRVHRALEEIAKLMPRSLLRLLQIVIERIPSIYKTDESIVLYIENMLKLESGPIVGSTMIMAVVDRLLKLDVEMNSEGLHKFISDNRKDLAALKEEIPLALKAAANPALLVLESVKGFFPAEATNADGKKDSNLLGLRRTCIMLMECLSVLLAGLDANAVSSIISEVIKERAKAIAEEWKPKLDALDMDANNGNSLEAHTFLQLLSTFSIASNFDEEEFSKLIPMVSCRRQTVDLCRSLGLSEKMSGVIEFLANSGRQIDVVNLAFAFKLTEQFSPVALLKSYLKEAMEVATNRCGSTLRKELLHFCVNLRLVSLAEIEGG